MNFKRYQVSENLSIIDTESYNLNNQYYKDTRITDKIEAGTYTISFYTDSTSDNLPLNCSLEKGSPSGVTGDIAWFNRAPVGDMTVQTFTITEPACIWMRFVRTGGKITGSISISRIRLDEGETPFGNWHSTPHYIHNTSTDTFTTLPAVIHPTGTTATVGLNGNTLQSSVPSPGNPIMPQGTGERTGNLYNINAKDVNNGYVDNMQLSQDGTMERYTICEVTEYIELIPNASYRLSNIGSYNSLAYCIYDDDKQYITGNQYSGQAVKAINMPPNGKYLRFSHIKSRTDTMLNLGSTAFPYEPWGVKIPISSANTTTPVYLGEVETTRKIKKLVLTGEENWQSTSNGTFYLSSIKNYKHGYGITICICSHFLAQNNVDGSAGVRNNNCSFFGGEPVTSEFYIAARTIATVTDFKAYLAAQYAGGTPVTVYYVLATEETAVVNEPLMKIGTYADSISGISIPTTAGANTLDVLTTLKPSEVTANFNGWHPVADVHERENGQWD